MNAPPSQQYLAPQPHFTIFLGLCALVLLTPTVGFAATPSDSGVDEVCVSLFRDARNFLGAGELEEAALQLSVAIEEGCEGDGDSEVPPRPDVAGEELVFETHSCGQFYRRAEGHIISGDARSARDAVQSMERLRCTWRSASEPPPEEVDAPAERDPVVEPAETEIKEREEEETEDGGERRAEQLRAVIDITFAPTTGVGAVGGLVTIEYYLDDYLAVTGRTGWLQGISGWTDFYGENRFVPKYRTSFLPIHGGIKYYLFETYRVFGFAEAGLSLIQVSVGMKTECTDEGRPDYDVCMAASEAPTERDMTGRPSVFLGAGYELSSAGYLGRKWPVFKNSQFSGGLYLPSIGDARDLRAYVMQVGVSF